MCETTSTARSYNGTHSVEENNVINARVKIGIYSNGDKVYMVRSHWGVSTSSNGYCQTKNALKKKHIYKKQHIPA